MKYGKLPREEEVQSLFMHKFFDTETREWDGRYSNDIELQNYSLRFISTDPYTIVAVPDEENISQTSSHGIHSQRG